MKRKIADISSNILVIQVDYYVIDKKIKYL